MAVIDALIETLRADTAVHEVRVGAHWTVVVARQAGLASTVQDWKAPHGHSMVQDVGLLHTKSALELANYARSNNPLEASIGMAAINSLLEVDESRCVELNARDFLIERGRDKRVALVGHFPFIPQLEVAVGHLWVLEQQPGPGELPASAAPEVIPQADVVAITAVTLINGTFDDLIRLRRPDALVMMLGGSAPLSPVLFDYGVDVISGTRVVDIEAVLRTASQGATFRQLEGIRLLTMTRN